MSDLCERRLSREGVQVFYRRFREGVQGLTRKGWLIIPPMLLQLLYTMYVCIAIGEREEERGRGGGGELY